MKGVRLTFTLVRMPPNPDRFSRPANPAPPKAAFGMSTHAHLRVLERTELSGAQLLERVNRRACAWLPRRSDWDTYFALVYCALSDIFVVAVIAPDTYVLKTVLTQHQWQTTYGIIAPVQFSLAQLAAAQSTVPVDQVAPVLAPVEASTPTKGLCLYVLAAFDNGGEISRAVLLGMVPEHEVRALGLGRITRPYPVEVRQHIGQVLVEQDFFLAWLSARLLDSGRPPESFAQFYLSFSRHPPYTHSAVRHEITSEVRKARRAEAAGRDAAPLAEL